MATRNTKVLVEILQVLRHGPPEQDALERLEEHFKDVLLIVAGNTRRVAAFAKKLRLHITPEERPLVLDRIASKAAARITIDHVEDAINAVFGQDRFIEP